VILVLTTVASYWYYLRVAWFMWMKDGPPDVAVDPIQVPFAMRVALVTCVVLILYLGVFPGATLALARSSVSVLSALGPELIGLVP
ncbi:MAG: hypothetical protein VYA48_07075, partial [Gemmatimonadota bacterium]|nr:hypothetical protein [Gemmatimonadota bacterium]